MLNAGSSVGGSSGEPLSEYEEKRKQQIADNEVQRSEAKRRRGLRGARGCGCASRPPSHRSLAALVQAFLAKLGLLDAVKDMRGPSRPTPVPNR